MLEFETVAEVEEALILDVRPASDYAAGPFLALSGGLDGQFAPWATLIPDPKQNLLLVCPEGQKKPLPDFHGVHDHTLGFLKVELKPGRLPEKEVDTVDRIQPEEFAKRVEIGKSLIVDVRKESEYRAEHVEEATNRLRWISSATGLRSF
ncbi:MAG: hypothetical protein R2792_18100 [Saprospiraceae bacterium]